MTYKVSHFIDGQLVEGQNSATQDIFNPATGEVIGKVELADSEIVDHAVKSAERAFPAWSAFTPSKRGKIMLRYLQLLTEHQPHLAEIVTREHGKTLPDAMASVQRGMEVVQFASGIANHLKGAFADNVGTGVDCYSIRQPLGVCAGITPFNFPVMIPLWMYPMAIACGNTFIHKPSEKDPSISLRLAELAIEAGVPPGVINVVQGDKQAVDALLNHPTIKAISFVGSTPVAEHVYKTATANGKRAQAFGGAKNHCIIMSDADLDQAADAIVGAAYGSAGERCMALSVAVAVGDNTADELIKRMTPKIDALRIGAGTEKNIDMGPLITQQHHERVTSYINLGLEEGATLVLDGRKADLPQQGFFMAGSLFDDVKPNMRIYQEEIFGPVLSIVRAKDFAEAVELINEHPYGNGTAIFTRSGKAAREFADRVQVGMVGINVPIPVPVAYHSFGGWKRSMFGDIHMHGPEGVQFYTKLKTITQTWPSGESEAEFTLPVHK